MAHRTGRRGKLYVLEGPDGVGKSTIANLTVQRLQSTGVPCLGLAFPGNAPGSLGGLVYDLHHTPEAYRVTGLHPMSLQVMHVAAHIDAIERFIKPAVETEQIVVLDRFWWSTLVYGTQTQLESESLDDLIAFEQRHWGELLPDTVFLISRIALDRDINSKERDELSKLYNDLALREKTRYPIVQVVNDEEISIAVDQVVSLIYGTIS